MKFTIRTRYKPVHRDETIFVLSLNLVLSTHRSHCGRQFYVNIYGRNRGGC